MVQKLETFNLKMMYGGLHKESIEGAGFFLDFIVKSVCFLWSKAKKVEISSLKTKYWEMYIEKIVSARFSSI